jgi:hypothetical protein
MIVHHNYYYLNVLGTMIKEWISWLVAYLEWGLDSALSYLMTVEGIAALLIGLFVLGLLARIRS